MKKILLLIIATFSMVLTTAQGIENNSKDSISPTDKALYNLSVDIENASRLTSHGLAMSISGGVSLTVGLPLFIEGLSKRKYSYTYNTTSGEYVQTSRLTSTGGYMVAFGTLSIMAGIVFTIVGGTKIAEGLRITNHITINTRGLVYKF